MSILIGLLRRSNMRQGLWLDQIFKWKEGTQLMQREAIFCIFVQQIPGIDGITQVIEWRVIWVDLDPFIQRNTQYTDTWRVVNTVLSAICSLCVTIFKCSEFNIMALSKVPKSFSRGVCSIYCFQRRNWSDDSQYRPQIQGERARSVTSFYNQSAIDTAASKVSLSTGQILKWRYRMTVSGNMVLRMWHCWSYLATVATAVQVL